MKYFLILLISVLLLSCNFETKGFKNNKYILFEQQRNSVKIKALEEPIFICPTYTFETPKVRGDSLKVFMRNALDTSLINSKDWEIKFFCAFPNSFKEMESLFGNPNNGGLYYSSELVKRQSLYESVNPFIYFFGNLNVIPEEEYYEKYINICLNGNYQADNIQTGFGFGIRILNHPQSTCNALSKRKDKDIKSVFKFIFDNVHPSRVRTKTFYNNLLLTINKENKRLARLLTSSYEELMTERHEH